MSEAIYERYKDSLRRGHVAAMRGRHEVALAAYVEAAEIAPERALPHTSIGQVYARLGRMAEALVAYDAALDRTPADEAALEGRAGALAALGRPVDAALTLDRLADVQEGAGRLAEAADTARRALELAEARDRRRRVSQLVARLREQGDDAPAAEALARAVRLLERGGPGGEVAASGTGPPGGREREDGTAALVEPPPPDPLDLAREAALAIDAGDLTVGRALALEAAAGFARQQQPDAALDACDQALAIDPTAADPHLALARLYVDRGWRSLAAEKLALLHRLAALDGDEATVSRVRSIVGERLPDDAALAAILGPSPPA